MRRRYVQIDGELVEVGDEYTNLRHANAAHNIIPDIQPYRSMIDGSEITSRSKHREHLKAHGCIEVGNETKYVTERKPLAPPPGLRDAIAMQVYQRLK